MNQSNFKRIRQINLPSGQTTSISIEQYLNCLYQGKRCTVQKVSMNLPAPNTPPKTALDDSFCMDDLPFEFSEHAVSANDEEKVIVLLKSNFVFNSIPQTVLSLVTNEMLFVTLPKGTVIYDKNDDEEEASEIFLSSCMQK